MTTHPVDGTVTVTLGGKERHLRLDFNALVALEDKLGRSLLGDDGLQIHSLREIRALLWACMLHEDPDVTEEEVGSWINAGEIATLEAAVKGITGAALVQSEEAGDGPLPVSPSPGSTSGRRAGSTSASRRKRSGA